MIAVDVCNLPATGGSTFVLIAGLFLLVAGVIVTRWVRQSAGRLSVVVAPLVLLGGLVLAPQVADPCAPATTTVPSATTTVPSATTTVPSATTTTTTTSVVGAALTPTFGSTTATTDGFTVVITNYDSSYTWAGTATASGSVAISSTRLVTVAISGTGLITVTGVAPGTSSTATITTTRTGYTGGTATVEGALYNVGQAGPGGGIIFYVDMTRAVGSRYFEAAPVVAQVQRTWATGANQTALVTGADGKTIGTGEKNTEDIVNQLGNVAATSAAVYCSDLVFGGQSDWFLPSQDELNQMYTNLHSASPPLGGFSSGYYWSSSELLAGTAWTQDFDDGYQSYFDKYDSAYVRPVRAF